MDNGLLIEELENAEMRLARAADLPLYEREDATTEIKHQIRQIIRELKGNTRKT